MLKHRLGVALSIWLVLVTPLIAPITGCDTAGIDNTNTLPPGTTARIQINTDPDDPMLGQLTGINNEGTFVFFGTKDANGAAASVELMQYFAPGSNEPYTFQFDDETRPIFITGPAGEVATLVYEGNTVAITFKDVDGTVSIETFPLDTGGKVKIQDQLRIARENLQAASAKLATKLSAAKSTVKVIRGFAKLELYINGTFSGKVSDAKVSVTATNAAGIIPVGFNPASGFYEFSVPHRVEDIQVLIDECELRTGVNGLAFTGAGVFLAFLAAGCIGLTSGFCGFIVGPVGAALGLGLGLGSLDQGIENFACDDLIIKAAVDSGTGVQNVTINMSHPNLQISGSKVRTYDLYNPADPITAAGSFEQIFGVDYQPSILDVRTTPLAPSAGASYSVTFDIVPPTASVRYTVTGSDGYTFPPETLTGNGTIGTLTGSSIPGGAANVTDTIVADILFNGATVGASKTISFTFH